MPWTSPPLRPSPRPWALVAAALLLTGCASGAGPADPTGIDQLVVPTPTPDPGDFAAEPRTDWLPLQPGQKWEYTGEAGQPGERAELRLLRGGREAGVATLRLSRTGAEVPAAVDALGVDTDGNVWWLAREGDFGPDDPDGVGLLLPAEPRVGDGWVAATLADGTVVRSRVESVDDEVSTARGTWDDAVRVETTGAAGNPTARTATWWVPGTGPVRVRTATGEVLDLVDAPRPSQ